MERPKLKYFFGEGDTKNIKFEFLGRHPLYYYVKNMEDYADYLEKELAKYRIKKCYTDSLCSLQVGCADCLTCENYRYEK